MRVALGGVLGVVGCAAEPPAPYRLSLALHPAEGVDLAGADFRVDATRADGSVEQIRLGRDGTGLPPLPDDTEAIAVVALDGETPIATGSAPFAGGTPPGSDAEVDLAVAPVADLALWSTIGEERRLVSGALALAADGRLLHFGGGDPRRFLTAGAGLSPDALTLDPDRGDRRFEVADGGAGLFPDGRLALTATPVLVDGAERILLVGGCEVASPPGDAVDAWLLVDPDGRVTDEGTLPQRRASHVAVPFRNGDVLVYGGYQDARFPRPSLDVFDAGRAAWKSVRTVALGTGAEDVAAAPLGDDVVVCGGVNGWAYDDASQTFTPSAGCVRVRPSGEVKDFDPLPEARSALALAPLGADGLLAVGGWGPDPIVDEIADGVISVIGHQPARATAWAWTEEGGWERVGDLAFPRAYFAAAALADGRVLVFGGADQGRGLFGSFGEPTRCAEVYDPGTRRFETGTCGDQGGGARPVWAARAGAEVAAVAGVTFDERTTVLKGGEALGLGAWGPAPD